MDAEHVDFKGKDNDEVTYPTATDSGVLALDPVVESELSFSGGC
jgi:hypothetical protein